VEITTTTTKTTTKTTTTPSTVLPKEWIARLFLRFRAIYGNRTDTAYGTADPDELIRVWAEELGRFTGPDIAAAIETMKTAYKEFPPTLPQFEDLCADSRARRVQASTKLAAPLEPPPPGAFEQLHAIQLGGNPNLVKQNAELLKQNAQFVKAKNASLLNQPTEQEQQRRQELMRQVAEQARKMDRPPR
jgi:hypothetical protein